MNLLSRNVLKLLCKNIVHTVNTANRTVTYKSALSLENFYPNSSLKLTTLSKSPHTDNLKFNGYIPIEKINITYSKSSGPGGQNVNRINTKVDVRFHVQSADWLSDEVKQKLLEKVQLLSEFYEECPVDRFSISFMEAHGTGTHVGDPEEGTAVDTTMTEGRKTPLLIGSVKSNIGHSEPVSGICSITKCIIGMEEGYIPPNIHFSEARDEIKGLVEGRMKLNQKVTKDGYLVFKSDLTRYQHLNLADCLEKIRSSIRLALVEKPEPTVESQERIRRRLERAAKERLLIKRERSQLKNDRQSPNIQL